jgi:hypothetical protein
MSSRRPPAARARRLYIPRPAEVVVAADGSPRSVDGAAVEALREEWRLEDRWWTRRPQHRRYFELILADGRDVVVFREGSSGRWFRQRA